MNQQDKKSNVMRQLLARLNPPAERSAGPSIPVASIGPDEGVELMARILAAMNLEREGLNQASTSGIDVGTASTFMTNKLDAHLIVMKKVVLNSCPFLKNHIREIQRMANALTVSDSEELLALANARMQEMQPSSSPSETSSLASCPLGERVDNDSEGEEWSAEGAEDTNESLKTKRRLFTNYEEEEDDRGAVSFPLVPSADTAENSSLISPLPDGNRHGDGDTYGEDEEDQNSDVPSPIKQLNDRAAEISMSEHIIETKERNSSFLQRSASSGSGTSGEVSYTFGHCDMSTLPVAFIISTLKNGGELKSILGYISDHCMALVSHMEVLSEVKRQELRRAELIQQEANQIVDLNMNASLSILALTFAKIDSNEGNDVDDGAVEFSQSYLAALAAYNEYAEKECSRLPKACTATLQYPKNQFSVSLCLVMAIRVATSILMSKVHNRVRRPTNDRRRNLELLFVLAQTVDGNLSRDSFLGIALYQYVMDILIPILDLSIAELDKLIPIGDDGESLPLKLIFIQVTTFLRDEMNDKAYIDDYARSESVPTVVDMDALSQEEIQRRSDELTNEQRWFCQRNKQDKVLTHRRQPPAAILFALINALVLAKTLKLQENTIDAFLFGLLCNAPSNYCEKVKGKVPLAFLFEMGYYGNENDDGTMEALVLDEVKSVVDTAANAMKIFKEQTHFAGSNHLTHVTKYLGEGGAADN